jgi:hypothetical protein
MCSYFELYFSWYFDLAKRTSLEVLSLDELVKIDVLVFGSKHDLPLFLLELGLLQLLVLHLLCVYVYLVGLVERLRLLILHLNDLLQVHLVVLSQLTNTPKEVIHWKSSGYSSKKVFYALIASFSPLYVFANAALESASSP